jgi:hypothetical protein
VAVIALSAREALFEYQDNSVSVLLAHGSRASSSPETPRRRPRSIWRTAPTPAHWPLSGFETIKEPDLRFRVLLTAGGSELKLARAQRKEARRGPPQPPTKVRLRCSYDRMPKKPDERALRYVKFCVLRQQGAEEDWIAQKLGPGTPEALYKQLSQDGFPSRTVRRRRNLLRRLAPGCSWSVPCPAGGERRGAENGWYNHRHTGRSPGKGKPCKRTNEWLTWRLRS